MCIYKCIYAYTYTRTHTHTCTRVRAARHIRYQPGTSRVIKKSYNGGRAHPTPQNMLHTSIKKPNIIVSSQKSPMMAHDGPWQVECATG